ncbi:MAG: ABC transporter substrate-binding protein [Betaproteobacteria bacterium]|nr:ABC transporter substrate-binding protein [Betaproteobacteria bacterium]
MKKRDALFVLLALAAVPIATRAQQPGKTWRIGYLSNAPGPGKLDEAFREQMRELGYAEGRNLSIEYRWGAGREERLGELAAELARLNVDVIVTVATVGAAAAKRATATIPVVILSAPDPVGSGLVASLARPGGNVTGVSSQASDLAAKRLQLLREVVPKATRIAVLAAAKGAPAFPLYLAQLKPAARQLGIALIVQQVSAAEDLAGAFALMQRERAQALIVHGSPFTSQHRKRIVDLAAQHRLATIEGARQFAEVGGLISYGPSFSGMYRRGAYYVDRIFKGAKPADLPVEQPTTFEMVINLKTAKALGVVIPQTVLLRADEVIR